jgi:3-isopropylmalate dehydrogenase/3-benzylmalate dehydrogenase
MPKQYRVVALPGEGIGIEVVAAALEILQQLAQVYNFTVTLDQGLIGEAALVKFGTFFPEVTAQLCQGADGILFGAVSRGGVLELRRHFNFFVNLRPVKTFPSLLNTSSLKVHKLQGVDILFVRELVSGLYFGPNGRDQDVNGPYGYHTMRYYDHEICRIARVALQLAERRRGLLTIAHKENALPHIPWCRLVQAEAQAYPQVTVKPMLIDTLAMQLVLNPQQFDVVLAGNLFGDILSDLGGAIVGSIGLLGSASFNAEGFGLYEPVHGTAPDIAGQGIANPLGMINSVILMLQHWGEKAAAQALIQAQTHLLAQGYRTADLVPQDSEILVNTQKFVQIFCQELREIKRRVAE